MSIITGGRARHCREVIAALPRREQVDILAGSVQDAVGLHGIAAGRGEPMAGSDPQTDLGQAQMDLFHLARHRLG